MQIQLDPNIPTDLSPEELRDFKSFIDVAIDRLIEAAGAEIFNLGNDLWLSLALIVVVLSGFKIAFSGNIQPWELMRVIIGLWIPWVMLQFYTTNIPGMATTFPGMIAAGGNWLHELLIGEGVFAMQIELGNLVKDLDANMQTQAKQGSVIGVLRGGIHGMITSMAGSVILAFMFLMLLVMSAVTYAQVIWAHVALAVLTILGPIFIPFLVFEPLAFLFWGWFRAMITYSLYAVIAGAVLRVFSVVGIAYVTSLRNTELDMQSLTEMGLWLLALVPLFIAGVLASLKVGELASMLVTSGGAAGSGLMGMATAGTVVASGGAAAAGKAAAGGVK